LTDTDRRTDATTNPKPAHHPKHPLAGLVCWHKWHETYNPTDRPDLAADLHGETPHGTVWHCLRCDVWIEGPPRRSGPADQAPILLRGKALRSAVILRALAAERLIRAVFLYALAFGLWYFHHVQSGLQDLFTRDLPVLTKALEDLGYHPDRSNLLHLVQTWLYKPGGTVLWLFAFLLGYATLQLVEGIGLWLMKRWGEYVAVFATSAFIPLEVLELVKGFSVLKFLLLAINIAAVAWLIKSKHLFQKNGKKKMEEELKSLSLDEIVEAARAKRTAPAQG
jgi:uncharacterized membrane protein (DUF2068 family)